MCFIGYLFFCAFLDHKKLDDANIPGKEEKKEKPYISIPKHVDTTGVNNVIDFMLISRCSYSTPVFMM